MKVTAGIVIALNVGMFSACGGGGGGVGPVALSGAIRGLAAGQQLVLSVDGAEQSFTAPVVGSEFPFKLSQALSPGQTYAIKVVKHPRGQICTALRSGSGLIPESVSDVLIECHSTTLNDTGISALGPDGVEGRDAESAWLTKVGSGAAGFDFSRICTSGAVADSSGRCQFPDSATWVCVRDNVTGLVWRRADVAYAGSAPAASEEFCGLKGWRAPTVHEMLSIVHAGKTQAPHIDTGFFDATAAPALTNEFYDEGRPLVVNFANSGAVGVYTIANPEIRRARWVWGVSLLNDPDTSAYRRIEVPPESDHVIIETNRELMWLIPKAMQQGGWTQALSSVETVNASSPGGYQDWRLPNRSELDSLANRSIKAPSMDPMLASAIANASDQNVVFWSSSSHVTNPSSGWVVDFSRRGVISPMPKNQQARLIYVRNRAFISLP